MSRNLTSFRAPFSGNGCSISTVVWCLVVFLLLLHFCSFFGRHHHGKGGDVQFHASHHPLFHELEELEEEKIQIPTPRRKKSPPPKAKPRAPKKALPLIYEFLDEKSSIRHKFFPGMRSAIGPRKNPMNDSHFYYPGKIWLDTEGHPIQAHGGGILYDERSRTYYWYGEYKNGPTYHSHKKGAARVDIIGVGCYSSKDFWTWKNEGVVLTAEANETHDLHKSNVLERPKVVYNEKTEKYVMWMHIDNANYTKAAVGIAISDSPTGPFNYLHSIRPHEHDSRDMTIFKDDDDVAYLVYSSENNSVLHIGPLTESYLDVRDVMRRIFVGQFREAPALFKHDGTYYMITSGCTGWWPNEALVHSAASILGPWETLGNPCVVGNKMFQLTTFLAQSSFVIPLKDFPGLFIFMADRWNPSDLRDSRYVWLPLIVGGPANRPFGYNFGFPVWSRVSIYWHTKWRLPSISKLSGSK